MARALYAPLLADPRRPANNARFICLDPAGRELFTAGTGQDERSGIRSSGIT
jgi:hypothetical protein